MSAVVNRTLTPEQDTERHEIIFGKDISNDYKYAGIGRFNGNTSNAYADGASISVETAQELIEKGYMDPDQYQNYSPSVRELVNFGVRIESVEPVRVSFGGYLIPTERRDCRVSLTELRIDPDPDSDTAVLPFELAEYVERRFGDADESTVTPEYARFWWD